MKNLVPNGLLFYDVAMEEDDGIDVESLAAKEKTNLFFIVPSWGMI